MYRFLVQFLSAPEEPAHPIFDKPQYRLLLDMLLTSQFIILHSSSAAALLKKITQGTRLDFLHRSAFILSSSLSLEVGKELLNIY